MKDKLNEKSVIDLMEAFINYFKGSLISFTKISH